METICLICGDKGIDIALDTCCKCRDYSCHRYCRRVQPEVFYDNSPWLCENCDPDFENVRATECSCSTSELNITTKSDEPQFEDSSEDSSSSEFGAEDDKCEGSDDLNEEELSGKDNDDQKLKKRRTSSSVSDSKAVSGFVTEPEVKMSDNGRPYCPQSQEKCNIDETLKEEQRPVTSKVPVSNVDPSNVPQKEVISGCVATVQDSKKRRLIIEEVDDEHLGTPQLPGKEKTTLKEEQGPVTSKAPVSNVELSNVSQKTVISGCVAMVQNPKKRRLIIEEVDDEHLGTPQLPVKEKTTLKEEQGPLTSKAPVSSVAPSNFSQKKVISGCVATIQNPKKRRLIIEEVDEFGKTEVQISNCEPLVDEFGKELQLVCEDKEAKSAKTSVVPSSDLKKPSHCNPSKIFADGSETIKDQELGKQKGRVGEQLSNHRGDVIDIKHSNISRHRVASSPSDKPKQQKCDEKPSDVQCPAKCDKSPNPRKEQASNLEEKNKSSLKTPRGPIGNAEPSNISPKNVITSGPVDRPKDQTHEQKQTTKVNNTEPANLARKKAGCGYMGEKNLVCGSRYAGNGPLHNKQQSKQNLGYRHKHPGTYGNNQGLSEQNRQLAEEDKAGYDLKSSGFVYRGTIWRGTLSISNRGSSAINRYLTAAHLSTLANGKASDMAKMLPDCLCLNTFSRSQLWPNCFRESGPRSHHIALYFFSNDRSDVFASLVNYMYKNDLAMIAIFEDSELVVFTSNVLPKNCQMIESKYFLWGGFRARVPSSLTNRLRCQQLHKIGSQTATTN